MQVEALRTGGELLHDLHQIFAFNSSREQFRRVLVSEEVVPWTVEPVPVADTGDLPAGLVGVLQDLPILRQLLLTM